jgi:hypothetical protein
MAALRFNTKGNRGKMPLPHVIATISEFAIYWLDKEVGVAFSHDVYAPL